MGDHSSKGGKVPERFQTRGDRGMGAAWRGNWDRGGGISQLDGGRPRGRGTNGGGPREKTERQIIRSISRSGKSVEETRGWFSQKGRRTKKRGISLTKNIGKEEQ